MKQKYRSKLESVVAKNLGKDWAYEPESVSYVVERNYIPDFVKGNICIEVKGYFRVGDQPKYIGVNNALKEQGRELVFILSDPNKPVRKGAKLTMAKWCEKHSIRYYSVDAIKELKKECK